MQIKAYLAPEQGRKSCPTNIFSDEQQCHFKGAFLFLQRIKLLKMSLRSLRDAPSNNSFHFYCAGS